MVGQPARPKRGQRGTTPKDGRETRGETSGEKGPKETRVAKTSIERPTRLPAFRCLCRSRTRPTRQPTNQPTNQTNPAPINPGHPSERALACDSGDGEKSSPTEAETKEAEKTSRRRKRRDTMTEGGRRSGYVKTSPEQGKCERRRRDGLPNETEPHTTSEMRRPGPGGRGEGGRPHGPQAGVWRSARDRPRSTSERDDHDTRDHPRPLSLSDPLEI